MATQLGSGGVCGFLRQYKTSRNPANNTFFQSWQEGNPLLLSSGPGFLNYCKVVVNTVPAAGLYFELQERGGSQTDNGVTLTTQYQLVDTSPIIVPVLDGAGNPISGISWEFAPPEEEWWKINDTLVRLGQGYDKGLVLQCFNADGTSPGEGGFWNINCRFVHASDVYQCRGRR